MQRARPTMISPTRYSSMSGRKIQASRNMSTGPMSQLSASETLNIFQAVVTLESCSYWTLVSTGYIIHSRPMAMGRETVSMRRASMASAMSGQMRPKPTPRAMVRKIHRGRNRSSRPSCPATPAVCGWAPASDVIGRLPSAVVGYMPARCLRSCRRSIFRSRLSMK